MRRKVIAGNWKMNMLPNDTIDFINELEPNIKNSESVVINSSNGNYTIVLSNGANYSYIKDEQAIYKNYQKISKNICSFTAEKQVINNKTVAKVTIGTGNNPDKPVYGKTINYVLKYW